MKDYLLNERSFDGLTAGMFINKVISEDEYFGEIFSGKIFPSLAVVNTTFPFLVYERQAVTPYYCKDGCYKDEVLLELAVNDDDYERCLTLLCGLRDLLEYKSYPEYNVDNIEISSATEGLSENGFQLKITLKITFI